jgi:protein phosphatase
VSPASLPFTVAWSGRTDPGRVRQNNEDDCVGVLLDATQVRTGNLEGEGPVRSPGLLLAVADGMGGALAGEVASSLAVEHLFGELARRTRAGEAPVDARAALEAAVLATNEQIRQEGEGDPRRRGMGTTLTAVWIHDEHAYVAHVGDSRAYLFRGGHLEQMTRDQSLVGKLLEDGIITEEQAATMAGRNIILQALGTDEPLEVATSVHPLEADDQLLLCTDGLCGVVPNDDLEADLRRGGTPATVADRLVDLANDRGGPDNITVLVATVERA